MGTSVVSEHQLFRASPGASCLSAPHMKESFALNAGAFGRPTRTKTPQTLGTPHARTLASHHHRADVTFAAAAALGRVLPERQHVALSPLQTTTIIDRSALTVSGTNIKPDRDNPAIEVLFCPTHLPCEISEVNFRQFQWLSPRFSWTFNPFDRSTSVNFNQFQSI